MSKDCLTSSCNPDCDCKCSILAAELEGIKLEMAIMRNDIQANTHTADTKLEETIKRLEQDLEHERTKNNQFQSEISILVNGRNAETAEHKNIINSLKKSLTISGAQNHSLRLEIAQLSKQSESNLTEPNHENSDEENVYFVNKMCDAPWQQADITSNVVTVTIKENENNNIVQCEKVGKSLIKNVSQYNVNSTTTRDKVIGKAPRVNSNDQHYTGEKQISTDQNYEIRNAQRNSQKGLMKEIDRPTYSFANH